MGRILSTLLALALLASSAPPAGADVGATIIERCTHGQTLTGFSQQAYRKALQEMTAEVNEYSDCANLVRKAQLAAAGGGGVGGSGTSPGGGGTAGSLTANVPPPTPAEQHALQAAAHKAGAAPVRVGEQTVAPGVVHANIASAVNALPTPLLALLASILAGALLILARAIRNRVRADRHS